MFLVPTFESVFPKVQNLKEIRNYDAPLGSVWQDWDMNDKAWTEAKSKTLSVKKATMYVCYGKYSSATPPFEVVTIENDSITVYDLFATAIQTLHKNQSKIEDGHFLVGLEEYEGGVFVTYFEA